MSSVFNNLFSINGVLDTGNPVLQNMQEIASACGCWLTYDINQGKWAVIINRAGSSTSSFNDSNIIGGINISSTGLTEVYNSVEIEFPHKDLQDQKDYIKLSISAGDRYPNEPDNLLSIKTELINDPLQAEMIATRELKQSRVDKVIQFKTDYSKIGIKAGDLIDVTNTAYGFSSKVFRIIQIDEEDADDGTLMFSITALEYSSSIYSTGGLVRSGRERASGITNQSINAYVKANDYAASTTAITSSLSDPTNAALIAAMMAALTRTGASVPGMTPTVHTFTTGIITASNPDGNDHEISLGYSVTLPYTGTYKTSYSINWGGDGDPGVNGVLKNSTLIIKSGGATINNTGYSLTGDTHVQLYEDHFLDSVWSGTAGQVVSFNFAYATNWGGSIGSGHSAIFLINGETKLVTR
jgi:hypothetical protein